MIESAKKYILLGVLILGLALVLYVMPERPLNEGMSAGMSAGLQLGSNLN